MTDEAKLHQALSRGDRAQALLNNDILKDAFGALERDYITALFETSAQDQIAREKLYLAVNVVRKVRDHLHHVVSDGKLAKKQIDQLAAESERKKLFGVI